MNAASKIDRSKPLKEQYEALKRAAEPKEETAPAEPANQNDCGCEEGSQEPPFDLEGESQTSSFQTSSSGVEMPPESDEIFKHKMGEALIPVALVAKFLALFPDSNAHRVQQLHGRIDTPTGSMRHVLVYDTYDNMNKYERGK